MYAKFSPQFIEASLNSQFTPGCKMPCPRCGHTEVSFSNPRRYLRFPVSLMLVALLLSLTKVTLAIGLASVAGIVLLIILSMESRYSCRHCGHSWRFIDAEKWAKAIRRDREAGAGN